MTMSGLSYLNIDPEEKNNYLYNGKELQEDFGLDWYDYGARFYDAQLGRFVCLDPISDEFYSLSPYNYASNNPVTNIDLWGLQGYNFNEAPKNASINNFYNGQKTYNEIGKNVKKYAPKIDLSKQKVSTLNTCNTISPPTEVNVNLSVGLQAGVEVGNIDVGINIASADIVSISNTEVDDYVGKDGTTNISQGISLGPLAFEHSFDAKPIGFENEQTSIFVSVPFLSNTTTFSKQENQGEQGNIKQNGNKTNIENDTEMNLQFGGSFFIGIDVEIKQE